VPCSAAYSQFPTLADSVSVNWLIPFSPSRRHKHEANLVSARAWIWILEEIFQHFRSYRSLTRARYSLDCWTSRALRSRIEPMMKVARMLRAHQELLLNWFRAEGEISSGAVEGLNSKIRMVTRRTYGFRTSTLMEIALYHRRGRLPEPELCHRFC